MKIDKLYTLSQFVDYLSTEYPLQNGESELLECADNFKAIEKYNDFLKQPLKREMFVNEVEKPMKGIYDLPQKRKWEKAEKKVIFDDNRVYLHFDHPDCVCIKRGGVIPYGWEMSKLAEATNGELKLKNVEL